MKLNKLFLISVAAVSVSACSGLTDFGDINVDPTKPSEPSTTYLLTAAEKYAPNFVMNSNGYDPWTIYWNGYGAESKNNQYGPLTATLMWNTSSYYLYPIKNLEYIKRLASDPENLQLYQTLGSADNQYGVASTLQAYFYLKMTDIVGPIVYSEALKGGSNEDAIWKPKYDTVKDVYYGLFDQLSTAYGKMGSGSLSSADIIYNGNIAKWKKMNAALRMLMAIRLSDVDPAKGKAEFAKAYADGGIVSNVDNFTYTFDANASNLMYQHIYTVGSSSRYSAVPNSQIVDTLKAYKDKRLFEYCDVNGYKGARSGAEDDFDSYFGVPHGLATNGDVNTASKNCCSFDRKLYSKMETPMTIIPASVVLFAQAEAAQLGWIAASAKDLYEDAIKASFAQWGAADVDEYIASERVAYSADAAGALYQIHLQRWIAAFFSDGVEAWADWRRTDVPFRPVGPGAANSSVAAYPYRLQFYADTDIAYNSDNVNAVLSDLSDGKDTRWSRLWWDVADNRTGVYPAK